MLDLEKIDPIKEADTYEMCKKLQEKVGDYCENTIVLAMITVLPQSSTRAGGNRYLLAEVTNFGDVVFLPLIDTAEMKRILGFKNVYGAYLDRGIRLTSDFLNIAKDGALTVMAKETHRHSSNSDYYKDTRCTYIGLTDLFKMLPKEHPLYNVDITEYWACVSPLDEFDSKPNKPTADLVTINQIGII